MLHFHSFRAIGPVERIITIEAKDRCRYLVHQMSASNRSRHLLQLLLADYSRRRLFAFGSGCVKKFFSTTRTQSQAENHTSTLNPHHDLPINLRFNVEAHTSIFATRFYTLLAKSGCSIRAAIDPSLQRHSSHEQPLKGGYKARCYSFYARIAWVRMSNKIVIQSALPASVKFLGG